MVIKKITSPQKYFQMTPPREMCQRVDAKASKCYNPRVL
ncbi:hypothetical protein CPter91_4416 [Collimonas pratensis]|uniref:Uncharacterized protein n=1 Tax=Collimonas pratensis TaxID=279113 RepID=A0A127QA31_9BURK|nr:hypothetical protein CPter91_4416 [Collimonas pratensis]